MLIVSARARIRMAQQWLEVPEDGNGKGNGKGKGKGKGKGREIRQVAVPLNSLPLAGRAGERGVNDDE